MRVLSSSLEHGPQAPGSCVFDGAIKSVGAAVQEHVKTMVMCQDYDMLETLKVTQTQFMARDVVMRRELWNRWAKDINDMDRMIELRKW